MRTTQNVWRIVDNNLRLVIKRNMFPRGDVVHIATKFSDIDGAENIES